MEHSSPTESAAGQNQAQSQTQSQTKELVAAVRAIRRHPAGYRAIHMHFSLLDRLHKQPFHRRTIATAFNKLIQRKSGQLFWLANFDLVFLCRDSSIGDLDSVIIAARRAVEDSPLIKEYKEAGRDDTLCDWYDLTRDLDPFLALVENFERREDQDLADNPPAPAPAASLRSMVSRLSGSLSAAAPGPAKKAPAVRPTRPLFNPLASKTTAKSMGPRQLDQLERSLVNMDVERMLAQQTAYVIVGNQPPEPVFEEHYISVGDLTKTLLPDYQISADKWLFQRLTRTFDLKMMQTLPKKLLAPNQVLSINVNVATIFTAAFDKFVTAINLKTSQPLILEMKLFDVIADIEQYYRARDKITRLGWRMSLDAMDIQSLAVLDRELLAVDFLKIAWKQDYKQLAGTAMTRKITAAIGAHGKMRIILCHCDSEDALDFGTAVGIHMYQGFLVDKLAAL